MMDFTEVVAMSIVVFILMAVGVFAYEGFKILLMDCWHRWMQWSYPDPDGEQFRSCRKCNLMQTRKIK